MSRILNQARALALVSGVILVASMVPVVSADKVAYQPGNPFGYVPNLGGNLTYAILYMLIFAATFYHTLRPKPKVDKWALCLPIGLFFAMLGYYIRVVERYHQADQGLYIVMYLFVVLSPATFLAFNYILFGRLMAALEGKKPTDIKGKSKYSIIHPRLFKIIFVTSDIITFLIQAAGGGLQTSNGNQQRKLGDKIFLAGVSAQGASYLLFAFVTLVAHVRLIRQYPKRFSPLNISFTGNPTVLLFDLVYISSVGIIIRSVYRIVENAMGYGGYLYTHEVFTFTLDALPLIIATGVWAIFWPGTLLQRIRAEANEGDGPDYNDKNEGREECNAQDSPDESRGHSLVGHGTEARPSDVGSTA